MYNENILFGHDEIFNEFIKLFENKKLPNKILLSGNKGIGKFLFVSHFINFVLSRNECFNYNIKNFEINNKNKSYILYKNNTHPNVYKVYKKNDKNSIEISQIRELIRFQNSSSFNNEIKFVVIDNVSNLNQNSSNALLKSIEEPNNNVYYIMTHNIGTEISDTLKSRCINFKMSLSHTNKQLIIDNYFSVNQYDLISKDFVSYYDNPSFLISLVNYCKENSLDISELNIDSFIRLIIDNKAYVKNSFIKKNIKTFIELYFYKKLDYSNNKIYKLRNYFYFKFSQIQKFNLDIENYFLEFKHKLLSE